MDIKIALSLQSTTVRPIHGNAEKIILCAQSITPLAITKLTRNRSGTMENMERLLNIWMDDQRQHDSPCSLLSIQVNALHLFEHLQQDGDGLEIETFVASRRWFERFKKHSNLHNIHVTGESASADKEAAAAYPAVLKKIIDDGGYAPQQVFNIDETGLFWK